MISSAALATTIINSKKKPPSKLKFLIFMEIFTISTIRIFWIWQGPEWIVPLSSTYVRIPASKKTKKSLTSDAPIFHVASGTSSAFTSIVLTEMKTAIKLGERGPTSSPKGAGRICRKSA